MEKGKSCRLGCVPIEFDDERDEFFLPDRKSIGVLNEGEVLHEMSNEQLLQHASASC